MGKRDYLLPGLDPSYGSIVADYEVYQSFSTKPSIRKSIPLLPCSNVGDWLNGNNFLCPAVHNDSSLEDLLTLSGNNLTPD
jgi:hypothetical protein